MWECALDEFIESINWVPQASLQKFVLLSLAYFSSAQSLKEGQLRKLSRKSVLQKTGTLVALRFCLLFCALHKLTVVFDSATKLI